MFNFGGVTELRAGTVVLPALADGTEAWTLIENIRASAEGAEEISQWKLSWEM